jgi:hypothetical protein
MAISPADPLQRACGNQLGEAAGQGAQHRGDRKDHQSDQEQLSPAVDVGELAVDRRHRRRGQQIGRDDPGEMAKAVQVGGDCRHRGDHHGLVDRGQEDAQQDAAEHPEDLPVCEARRRRIGR